MGKQHNAEPTRRRRGRRPTIALGSTVALVLAVAIAGPSAGPVHAQAAAAARSGEFGSLTYNVAGLPEPLSGSEPDINTPLISPLLNPYDLVLVQEDWIDPEPANPAVNFHHDDLISQVTHPYKSTPATPPLQSDPRRPSAFVADGLNYLSRFPITDPPVRVMWPSCFGGPDQSDGGAGDCLSLKGFELTKVTIDTNVVIDVYNLHAEAGSTPADVVASAEDYETLAAFINANSSGNPIIVGGDTNLSTDGSVDGPVWRKFLSATGLADVCDVLDCGADDHIIDKFAFKSAGGINITPKTHVFERQTFTRASDGAPLSDHDPLSVRWAWTAPALPPTTTTSSTALPSTTIGTTRAVVATPRFTG